MAGDSETEKEETKGQRRDPQEIEAYQGPVSRIPRLCRNNPVLWFATCEAVFLTSKVTSSTIKFQLLVPNIDQDVLIQVQDLITDPLNQTYENLKARLLQTYGESENLRIKKLLEDIPLGDQTPSQLLRRMQQLAGDCVNAEFIRTLWLKNLPTRFQPILAATEHTDVEKLAAIADKIHEVSAPPEAYTITRPATSRQTVDKSSRDHKEDLRDLRQDIDRILGILGSRERGRSLSRGRNGARSRSKSHPSGICYYHRRFQEKSFKYRKPCKWEAKSPEPNLNSDQ
ncbi:uncharacterized protein [Halyomorpha halys]|uniref:uncharacterized protein n=1 Tax=Halyomorpha halys TaxID=286706 RepID=UPI0006D51A98|nr:uncharacterized protein LOC106690395 [Halyomorpha halys]